MKKLLLLLLLSIVFISCGNERTYRIAHGIVVPDSNQTEYAKFVKETVAGASYYLTTSDYEDPEDVVRQAESSGLRIYGKTVHGMEYKECWDCGWYNFVAEKDFNEYEARIYQKLLKGQ